MSSFLLTPIVKNTTDLANLTYPLHRGKLLHSALAHIFSRYMGNLKSGLPFEAEGLLVTGKSGVGKTHEINDLLRKFNDEAIALPSGKPARIVKCILDGKTGWKGLGLKTLHALGYNQALTSKATQARIWEKVILQAQAQGVIGIHYDEAQHILRGKSENERFGVLDSFKTLLKGLEYPLILILSGVPELSAYIQEEPQLQRLLTQVQFPDLELPTDLQVIHEIVSSFAIKAEICCGEELPTEDFYRRLTAAASYRCGLVIQLTIAAIASAQMRASGSLHIADFSAAWQQKPGLPKLLDPFTHPHFENLVSRDNPFSANAR